MSKPQLIAKIAVTGSCGKTATREFIAAILKRKWKVLTTTDNRNLPGHTKQTMNQLSTEHQAVVLEMGMGKQGAGARHCQHVTPNVSVITNIGTAHYGNLGNSIRSTAQFKSALIKHMNPKGRLLVCKDDKNSSLLETKGFQGRLLTVGIDQPADYRAEEVRYTSHGMRFVVRLGKQRERFFIPVFGRHNVYNALFAIAIADQYRFTAADIRSGLAGYNVPHKRLNVHPLQNQSLLIDDTINANPQSMRAAIDVLSELGKGRQRIAVLGTMLELGDYTTQGHREVGRYAAQRQLDFLYTYGEEARWIGEGAIEAGYPASQIRHFTDRSKLHFALRQSFSTSKVVLVKGSSHTKMDETAAFLLKKQSLRSMDRILISQSTLARHKLTGGKITLHYGAFTKTYPVEINNDLPPGRVIYPRQVSNRLTIPDVPLQHYWEGQHLHVGPVIGMHIKQTYALSPSKQLPRFTRYNAIKGVIYLFKYTDIDVSNRTIKGLYYDPAYPSSIFNRALMPPETYRELRSVIGDRIFNYPYGNVNKWEQWRLLSTDPALKRHMPHTRKYTAADLHDMLSEYKCLYIKPTSLAGGKGMMYVKAKDKGIVLTDSEGNRYIRSPEKITKLILRK